ncbi:MAG: hypothetical protein HY808_16340 [Nitrospirae bacterium]|nr:hypothetical protein [Nitrospirota bacterium]
MNIRYTFIGIIAVLAGVWLYAALSALEVEEGSFPKKVIIKEGIIRSEEDVARVLSDEKGFDLEGAYKTGFSPLDVIDYLSKEPHKYPVTLYDGKFYEGRQTVVHLIPLSVCILLIAGGILLIILKGRAKKS